MSEKKKYPDITFGVREYEGKTYLTIQSRVFTNKDKVEGDKRPNYKSNSAAVWEAKAQDNSWAAIDIKLEPSIEEVIEFLENNGYTVGKAK
jgi:3-dehydroquinate dehydratase